MRNLVFFSLLFFFFSCGNSPKNKPQTEETIKQSSEFKSLKFDSEFFSKTTFLNGDKIQQAQSADEWTKLCAAKKPTWCYVDVNNKKGILYNYYVLSDSRGIIEKPKCFSKKQAELLINDLSNSNQNLIFDSLAKVQRTFYGANRDLGFVQFWIFDDANLNENKASVMVFDLKLKRFRMDLVSINNGYRIWSLK